MSKNTLGLLDMFVTSSLRNLFFFFRLPIAKKAQIEMIQLAMTWLSNTQ